MGKAMRLRADICLIAVLGLGLFCAGGKTGPAISDFCQQAARDIAKIERMSREQFLAQERQVRDGLLALKQKRRRLCT
jgi:hypothetical protein